MPTDLSSIVVETLEAPLPTGTVLSSVVIETLEAPLPTGTVLSSVVIETLEAPLPPNTAPVSDAGPDQTVSLGSIVQLDGTGSYDPDGDPLIYRWKFIKVPVGSSIVSNDMSNRDVPSPTFTPDIVGVYIAFLLVTDPSGLTDDDTVNITVEIAAPVGFPGEDLRPLIGLFAARRKRDS